MLLCLLCIVWLCGEALLVQELGGRCTRIACCRMHALHSSSSNSNETCCLFVASAYLSCSTKHGANYSTPCVTCAALGAQPANVQKCMSCIARASKVACSDNSYPYTCWNPQNSGSTSCSTCATSAKDYETCVVCLERKPFSDSCVSCSFLKDATKQAKCYNCTKAAGLPGTTCYDCVNYLTDAKAVEQCHQCAMNTKAPVEGRQWCYG
jgi:hypothetical protein